MLYEASPLAMAGVAEAAEHIALMLAWCGLLTASIAALVALALAKRSWIPLLISAIALAGVTFLFTPWCAFAPVSPHDLKDPDVVHWIAEWREMAAGWIVVILLFVVAALVVNFRHASSAALQLGRNERD